MPLTNNDKQALFNALAAQLKGLSPHDLQAADLVQKGLITPYESDLISRLVDQILGVWTPEIAPSALGDLTTMAPDAERDAPDAVPAVEETAGRYRFVSHYARGGMGQILLVRDEHLGRTVALKELLPQEPVTRTGRSLTDKSRERRNAARTVRFLQEARITGQLEHPGIVPVYELGRRQDGTLYFTMKLVKGKNLAESIRNCQSLEQRMKFLTNFIDLCHAIAYAHSRGVIHRDIKPSNIMAGDFGETIVLDWGLAKARGLPEALPLEEDEVPAPMLGAATIFGKALGTPNYMPPEQAQGLTDKIDERSDVYSLGAVLYEILTGVQPYAGQDYPQVIHNVVHETLTPVLQLVPDAAPELATICHKALQKDPARRYQSAAELADDVHRFVTGRLVQAYQYSPRDVIRRLYKKYRAAFNVAAGSLAVLIVTFAYSYLSVYQARNSEHKQRVVAEKATQQEAKSRSEAERTGYIAQLALIQEYIKNQDYAMANEIAREVPESQKHWEWRYLINRANPQRFCIKTTPCTVTSIALNPDATLAATTSLQGNVQLWDLATQSLVREFEDKIFVLPQPIIFSPDGRYLAGVPMDGTAYVWDVSTGKRLCTLKHDSMIVQLQFSPASNQIITASEDATARLWEIPSGKCIAATEPQDAPLQRAVFSANGKSAATVSTNEQIKVWDLKDAFSQRFECPGRLATFGPDNSTLAVYAQDTLTLYDLASNLPLREMKTATAYPAGLFFSADSTSIFLTLMSGTVFRWDAKTGELLKTYPHAKEIAGAQLFYDESVLVTFSFENDFIVWDTASGSILNHMTGNGSFFQNQFASARNVLATANNEESIQVWAPLHQTGCRLVDYGEAVDTHGSDAVALAGVSEKARLVAVSKQRKIEITPLDSTAARSSFVINARNRNALPICAFSPDASRVALALDRFTVIISDLKTNNCIQLTGQQGCTTAIAFDPSGQRVAAANEEGFTNIYDAASGELLHAFQTHSATVDSVSFSPDGTRLLTASADATAAITPLESNEAPLTLKGHTGIVFSAAFSTDGKRVFTASEDRTARVWDAQTGAELSLLRGHSGMLSAISASSDGKYVLTCGNDRTAQIRDASTLEPLLTLPQTNAAVWLPQSQQLLVHHYDGRTELCEAAWQDMPQQNWNDQNYTQYRSNDYDELKGQEIPEIVPGTITVFASPDTLTQFFKAAMQNIQALPISDLGLSDNDQLVHLDGIDAADSTAIQDRLKALLNNPPEKSMSLDIRRDNQPVAATVLVLKTHSFNDEAALPRAELARLLAILATEFPQNSIAGTQPESCQQGLEAFFKVNSPALEALKSLKLCNADFIMAIDGRPINTISDLQDFTNHLAQDTKPQYTLDVQRGEFMRYKITWNIQ